jgi:hypothetical protein
MSDWKYQDGAPLPAPVAPAEPQPVFYQPEPAPPQYWDVNQARAELVAPEYLFCCDACGEPIEPGEPCIELFYGQAGTSPKTGNPMVVESPLIDYPSVSLHEWCVGDFAKAFIYDDGEPDEPQFCAGCEAKLSGD